MQTFIVKTFLLLQEKVHLTPSQDCLSSAAPTGRWAPSPSPVLPYSTEHPPLSLCSNGLHNTSDPSATATETVALPVNQDFNPRVSLPQQSLAVYGDTKGERLQFSLGYGFHFQLCFFQLRLHLWLRLPRNRDAPGSFKWAGLGTRSSMGVEFNLV